MTVVTMIAIFFRKKIGLYERKVLMQSTNTMLVSGVVNLIKKVLLLTLVFELIGATLLSIRFIPKLGVGNGIYYSIFHSISAFCNAGFDLMGFDTPFGSLTSVYNDPIINLTIIGLIVIGGTGFFVWSDVIKNKFKFNKLALHSKIVITSTAILIALPTLLFFLFERNHAFAGKSIGEQVLMSLFQAVTPRTAGFNTCDLTSLSNAGRILTNVLMFIGGNSGSTAGGIKVTTFVVLILGGVSSARNKSDIVLFKKRLDPKLMHTATSITLSYLLLILSSASILCATQPSLAIDAVFFEVTSALGTVGLSMGITPSLVIPSKLIIMLLMYIGRLGALTFALALAEKTEAAPLKRPIANIMIG